MKLAGCFVTGTDTGVGKTLVSAALLQGLAAKGLRVAGFKPVAAGLEPLGGRLVNADVQALRAASTVTPSDAEVGPLQFADPCAPHIAAALEGRRIDAAPLLAAAQALAARCDRLIVEGVGGFCVPLHLDAGDAARDWGSDDLAVALGLPVVLVVGLRLGCLNHALLTAEAVRARGLRLIGWVANRIDPAMRHPDDNLMALQHALAHRHAVPCLGDVPWQAEPDAAAAAKHLHLDPLLD